MESKEAKNLVVKAGLELVRSGLIARTWGNVSCRIDGETFAITPSGRDYRTLTAEDIVEVKIKDLSYEGNIKPSSEKGIHGATYRLCPEMNFVIHTHQENASAVSASGLASFSPISGFPELGSSVICAKYALPGTKALIRNVEAALKISTGHAVILKHHGVLCFGRNYEDTFLTARHLETASGAFINENGGNIQTDPPGGSPAFQDGDGNQSATDGRSQSITGGGSQPAPDGAEALAAAWKASGRKGRLLFNTDPDVVRFSKLGSDLKPLLDDFAQIVGTKIRTVKNNPASILGALTSVSAVMVRGAGAVCWGINEEDAEAASMIVRKNCKAYFAASAFGQPKYIKPWERALMRRIYLKKYSKMNEINKSGGNR